MELIEIISGLFYNPNKKWFEQPQKLVDLALSVMETTPDYIRNDEFESNIRLNNATWEHLGVVMTITMHYTSPIENRNFLTRLKNDSVDLNFFENE